MEAKARLSWSGDATTLRGQALVVSSQSGRLLAPLDASTHWSKLLPPGDPRNYFSLLGLIVPTCKNL